MSPWRKIATEVIHKAVKELEASEPDSEKLFSKISKERYPFGERRYHPYKIWLDEIAVQKDIYTRKTWAVDYNTGLFAEPTLVVWGEGTLEAAYPKKEEE